MDSIDIEQIADVLIDIRNGICRGDGDATLHLQLNDLHRIIQWLADTPGERDPSVVADPDGGCQGGYRCRRTHDELGANDCLELPVSREQLQSAVKDGLRRMDPRAYPTQEALTPTELKILRLVLSGRSTREIADVLHLSDRTVSTHRQNIRRKVGVSNSIELIRWAIGAGLLTPDERVR